MKSYIKTAVAVLRFTNKPHNVHFRFRIIKKCWVYISKDEKIAMCFDSKLNEKSGAIFRAAK